LFATKSLHSGDLLVAKYVERLIGRPLPKLWAFLERFVEAERVAPGPSP
jgi:hypothetical protein